MSVNQGFCSDRTTVADGSTTVNSTIVVNGNTTIVGNIVLGTNSTIIVNGGSTLTITGTLTINGGSLSLQNASSGTFTPIVAQGSISGTFANVTAGPSCSASNVAYSPLSVTVTVVCAAGLSNAAIVGIAVGSAAGVCILIAVLFWACLKASRERKRKKLLNRLAQEQIPNPQQ